MREPRFNKKAAQKAFRNYCVTTIITYVSHNPDEEVSYDNEYILENNDDYSDFIYRCVEYRFLSKYGREMNMFIRNLPRWNHWREVKRAWDPVQKKYIDTYVAIHNVREEEI